MELQSVWFKYVTYSFCTYGYNTPFPILHIPQQYVLPSTRIPPQPEKEKRNGRNTIPSLLYIGRKVHFSVNQIIVGSLPRLTEKTPCLPVRASGLPDKTKRETTRVDHPPICKSSCMSSTVSVCPTCRQTRSSWDRSPV